MEVAYATARVFPARWSSAIRLSYCGWAVSMETRISLSKAFTSSWGASLAVWRRIARWWSPRKASRWVTRKFFWRLLNPTVLMSLATRGAVFAALRPPAAVKTPETDCRMKRMPDWRKPPERADSEEAEREGARDMMGRGRVVEGEFVNSERFVGGWERRVGGDRHRD